MILVYDNRFRLPALFGILFLSAVITAHFIIQSAVFKHHPLILSNSLSADFIITLPFIAWVLLVRKKLVNIHVFLTLISVCYFTVVHLLPQQQNLLLQYVKYVLAASELISICWIIVKIRKINRFYQSLSASAFDFPEKLQLSLESVFGKNKIASALAAEFGMIRYALFFWYKRKENQQVSNQFSIYKNTPFVAFIGVFLFMLILEMGLIHLLLLHFKHEKIAFGLLITSIYSLLFIVAHLNSVQERKIVVTADEIKIRIGLIYTAQIKIAQIKNIDLINASFTAQKTVLNLAKPLFNEPNLLLQLKEPVAFSTAFGLQKRYSQLTLHIDQKEDFLETVKSHLTRNCQ